MTKERELLERAFESMKNRNLLTENERTLEKEISYYLLSTQEPEGLGAMMNRGRELLARTLKELSSQDAALRQEFEGLLGFLGPLTIIEEIRAYLVEPTQESKPIAYWDTQNGTLIPAVPLSSERTCFEVPLVPLYLSPRADAADELIKALIAIGAGQGDPKEVSIQALENYMEEK